VTSGGVYGGAEGGSGCGMCGVAAALSSSSSSSSSASRLAKASSSMVCINGDDTLLAGRDAER